MKPSTSSPAPKRGASIVSSAGTITRRSSSFSPRCPSLPPTARSASATTFATPTAFRRARKSSHGRAALSSSPSEFSSAFCCGSPRAECSRKAPPTSRWRSYAFSPALIAQFLHQLQRRRDRSHHLRRRHAARLLAPHAILGTRRRPRLAARRDDRHQVQPARDVRARARPRPHSQAHIRRVESERLELASGHRDDCDLALLRLGLVLLPHDESRSQKRLRHRHITQSHESHHG